MRLLKSLPIIIIIIFNSCSTEKEEPFKYQIVNTYAEIEQDKKTVTFYGEIISEIEHKTDSVGFVWGYDEQLNIVSSFHNSKVYENDIFSLITSIEAPQGMKTYYKAYTKEGSNFHYGPIHHFTFIGEEMKINKLEPNPIVIGDTLSILGDNFGVTKDEIKVFFEDNNIDVISVSDTLIIVKTIPNMYMDKDYQVSINRVGNTIKSQELLHTQKIEIVKLDSYEINSGEDIELITNGVPISEYTVILDGSSLSSERNGDTIRVSIPYDLKGGNYSLTIISDINRVTSPEFKYNQMNIFDDDSNVSVGDTITFYAEFLNTNKSNYKVNIGRETKILALANDSISIIIPFVSSPEFKIEIYSGEFYFSQSKKLRTPKIKAINKESYVPGDTLVLYGENLLSNITMFNFHPTNSGQTVRSSNFLFNTNDSIGFINNYVFNDELFVELIYHYNSSHSYRYKTDFVIPRRKLIIESIYPEVANVNDDIIVNVKNAGYTNKYWERTGVSLGDGWASMEHISNTELRLDAKSCRLLDGTYKIKIIDSEEVEINIINAWKKVQSYNYQFNNNGQIFGELYNDDIFFMTRDSSYDLKLHKYSTSSNLLEVSTLPYLDYIPMGSEIIDDKLYFVVKHSSSKKIAILIYDLKNHTWTKSEELLDNDSDSYYIPAVFGNGGFIYCFTPNKRYKFSIIEGKWTEIGDNNFDDYYNYASDFEFNGKEYIYFGNMGNGNIYTFNPVTETLEFDNNKTSTLGDYSIPKFFALDNKLYRSCSRVFNIYSIDFEFIDNISSVAPNNNVLPLFINANEEIYMIDSSINIFHLDKNLL